MRGPLAEGLNPVADVAVVAHSRKNFGGGLPELRKVLAEQGVTDPIWHEVTKSRFAPEYARRAVAQGVRRHCLGCQRWAALTCCGYMSQNELL